MQQAPPAIVTRIQKTTSQLSTPVTLHTKPCQNERRKSLKNVKLQPIYIKSLGFVFFFWTWFTHMHISTVMFAPNLQNIMSPSNWQKSTYFHKKTFRQKIRCKISRFHLSFPSLSLSGRPNNANKLGGEKLFISLGPLFMTMMAMTMMTMMTMLMMVMMMSKVWWEA